MNGSPERPRSAPRLDSNVRHTVVLFGAALAVVTYLDRVMISTAAPFIMADLHLSVLEMSVVFSAFTLAYSIFEIPSGWMSDVWGARSVLTRIVLWWSGFTMLTGAAWNYRSLVATRFLFGAGEAGAFPGVSRVFSRWLPAGERGRANGWLFLGSRAGGALAPALSLLLIHRWGWRASFVVFDSLGVFWVALWQRFYRNDPAAHSAVSASELSWIREGERSSGTLPSRRRGRGFSRAQTSTRFAACTSPSATGSIFISRGFRRT